MPEESLLKHPCLPLTYLSGCAILGRDPHTVCGFGDSTSKKEGDRKMNFLTANIDRAIVMTQYDLRGFSHPVLRREEGKLNPKYLEAITGNLVAFAAGSVEDREPTDENYVTYFGSLFRDYLAMCQRLAEDCDRSEAEAIRLIVQEIVKQSEEMKAEFAAGKRTSAYLWPLEKDNRWGRAVLALAEAFEVDLGQKAA